MSISRVRGLEEFLRQASLVRDAPTARGIQLTVPAHAPKGTLVREVAYLQWPDAKLQLKSVLGIIQAELEEQEHPADDEVALMVLALCLATLPEDSGCVEHLLRCFGALSEAVLHQAVVFPHEAEPQERIGTRFGNLEFVSFDPKDFTYWAKRGHSSFNRDLETLRGRFCIRPDRIEDARVIDWMAVPGVEKASTRWGSALVNSLLDAYYRAAWSVHRKSILEHAKASLLLLEAGALLHIDLHDLVEHPFSESLGLFVLKSAASGTRTFAMRAGGVLTLNRPPREAVVECKKWLQDLCGDSAWSESMPLAPAIKSFGMFLQRAHEHRLGNQRDEALIHFVIALDLLLGDPSDSAETVAQRAAVLAHRSLKLPLEDVHATVKELYGYRSRYVHDGRPVPDGALEKVEALCLQVLWALLVASSAGRFKSLALWVKELDTLYNLIPDPRADVPEDDLEAVGIWISGPPRLAPNHIEISDRLAGGIFPVELWEARRKGNQ